jgi:hypothetical protein
LDSPDIEEKLWLARVVGDWVEDIIRRRLDVVMVVCFVVDSMIDRPVVQSESATLPINSK